MWKWAAAALIGLVPGAVHGACIHHGLFYATTTLEQEFAESRWVVLARVESARDHRPDDGAAWSLYRLRVLRTYKGRLPERFSFLTDRNTGGFYMDRPWEGHDIGGEYLVPEPAHAGRRSAGRAGHHLRQLYLRPVAALGGGSGR